MTQPPAQGSMIRLIATPLHGPEDWPWCQTCGSAMVPMEQPSPRYRAANQFALEYVPASPRTAPGMQIFGCLTCALRGATAPVVQT